MSANACAFIKGADIKHAATGDVPIETELINILNFAQQRTKGTPTKDKGDAHKIIKTMVKDS